MLKFANSLKIADTMAFESCYEEQLRLEADDKKPILANGIATWLLVDGELAGETWRSGGGLRREILPGILGAAAGHMILPGLGGFAGAAGAIGGHMLLDSAFRMRLASPNALNALRGPSRAVNILPGLAARAAAPAATAASMPPTMMQPAMVQ